MKVVFAGGMTISAQILDMLCREGEIPVHTFGYPPSLAHRSNYMSLDSLAEQYNFPLTKLKDINDLCVLNILKRVKPDWFFVFGWSQLVKKELLTIAKYGTLGLHMSNLPEGRGRAPVAWTIIKGKTEGCVSLIWLEPEADSGPIAVQRTYQISPFDDAGSVVNKVNLIACEIIKESLSDLRKGSLQKINQDDSNASYWEKRTPQDGIINWSLPVRNLYNFIRGTTSPFPGAFAYIDGIKVIVWKSGMIEMDIAMLPGTIIGEYFAHDNEPEMGIAVASNGGILILKKIKIGNEVLSGKSLLEKANLWKGKQFDS
jgi:methionyl-tRNA formyltransferase